MTITPERLKALADAATPLPWRWFTSNSMSRLSSAPSGKDGDVLSAFRATDGVACLSVSESDKNYIEAAVNAMPELVAHIEDLESKIESLTTQLSIATERAGNNFDRAEAAEKELESNE